MDFFDSIVIPMSKEKNFYLTDVIVNRIQKWVVDMEKSFITIDYILFPGLKKIYMTI